MLQPTDINEGSIESLHQGDSSAAHFIAMISYENVYYLIKQNMKHVFYIKSSQNKLYQPKRYVYLQYSAK